MSKNECVICAIIGMVDSTTPITHIPTDDRGPPGLQDTEVGDLRHSNTSNLQSLILQEPRCRSGYDRAGQATGDSHTATWCRTIGVFRVRETHPLWFPLRCVSYLPPGRENCYEFQSLTGRVVNTRRGS